MSCEATDAASGLRKHRLQCGGYSAEVRAQGAAPVDTARALGVTSASLLQVFEHGAHVTSWRDPAGNELLFVSKKVRHCSSFKTSSTGTER